MFDEVSVDSTEGSRLDWLTPEASRPNLSPDGSHAVYVVDPKGNQLRPGDRFSIRIETSGVDGSNRRGLSRLMKNARLGNRERAGVGIEVPLHADSEYAAPWVAP